MKTADFLYDLPPHLIAQVPVQPRDASRLMAVTSGGISHLHFRDLPMLLRPGDALAVNDTKVIPARLIGAREGGGACELLLLRQVEYKVWEALARPGRRMKPGSVLAFGGGRLTAEVLSDTSAGGKVVRFICEGPFEAALDALGEMPLPPYIREKLGDRDRYQTVYARHDGSAAAPTAGLHFTPELMDRIRDMGVDIVPLLLHVGLGTFRPVQAENVEDHHMHQEYFQVSADSARRLNAARARGGRIVAVGTTSVRTLESAAGEDGRVKEAGGFTGIFITPGYKFRAVDAMITNFHLPGSTLIMLVSAFMGRERALSAYREAVAEEYRFFSFGDAMFIEGGLPDELPG